MAAIVGLLVLSAALRAARRSSADDGTPASVLSVYLALWAISLLLFAVPLLDYSSSPLVAWVGIYGAIATGAAASWHLARRLRGSISDPSQAAASLRTNIDAASLRLTWALCAVLGLVGAVAFVYAVSRVLPASAVVTDPESVRIVKRDSVRFQDVYGPWKFLTYINLVAFVLWTVGLRTASFAGRWRPAVFAGAFSLAPFVFTADRNLLVSAVIWAGALHLVWPARLELRRAVRLLLVGGIAVGIAVTLVGNRYGGSLTAHPEVAEHLNTRVADAVAIPYLYLTGNLPAFGQLTQDELAPFTAGQMSVLPLRKLADAAGVPGHVPVATGVFYPIPFESFSNYSWLGTFWLDFRLPGVLLLSALLTGAATALQVRARRVPTLGTVWLASVLLYVIALSPFANALTATLTWQFLLMTPLVALAVDRDAREFVLRRLRALRPRAWAVGATAALLSAGGLVAAVVRMPRSASTAKPVSIHELTGAVARSRLAYEQHGRYPSPDGLATRLHVNRPDLTFRPQLSYTEPVTEPGVIAVFSTPQDVFLRIRHSDGRLYEIHRTEDWGGVTFGPGTRDG